MTANGQLPRRSVRPSGAVLRAAEAEAARPLAVRLADRRFTGRLLLLLGACELANAVYVIAADAAANASGEVATWATALVRLAISAALYLLAFQGFRVAWWLSFARLALGDALYVLDLTMAFDISTVVFLLVFTGLGLWLLLSPRVRAYRADRREKRTFA